MYLAPRVQNELLSTVAGLIKDDITDEILKTKYFSIIADEEMIPSSHKSKKY
ncbi:hypothetical protein Pmar_PMAR003785 [Perkinsus marinus ATCC 50983]|uniref:DUF4371 domain-containing protein n=1 Tax=Perkinsus marinus (strain ATCC 50983 / TXsc) TaxID=423536 RepID=C5LV52_PERM5|nr:hypothetical protein Pmar_PMAR003785 [Perkinsus marinus ATCC 50983]EEQ99391.1 hypothetical protein Pmar_PMAR003785 [Perkinsus marinus ATCC 50983]|eukprot:XP_002766674.1 hypothetical protein Pmar_PMAR003785 [Perkinsus marinus ATCC 50983]